MTHHDGDTPVNGNDQDGMHRDWFRDIPGLGTSSQGERVPLDDLDDDFSQFIGYVGESAFDEQEHDELVGRLMREGDVLRTELGLPGFSSADMPPCASPAGVWDELFAEHADGAVLGLDVLRFALAQVRVERARTKLPWRRARLGRLEADLTSILEPSPASNFAASYASMTEQVLGAPYTASERVRRMVVRYKADLARWFCMLYGSVVLTGYVAFSVPAWLSTGSWVLLGLAAASWWHYLGEDLHEPGIDQQLAPNKDDQRM